MFTEPNRLASRYEAGFSCPRCGLYGIQEWTGLVHERTDTDATWNEPFISEGPATTAFDTFASTRAPWDRPSDGTGGRVVAGTGSTPINS